MIFKRDSGFTSIKSEMDKQDREEQELGKALEWKELPIEVDRAYGNAVHPLGLSGRATDVRVKDLGEGVARYIFTFEAEKIKMIGKAKKFQIEVEIKEGSVINTETKSLD